MSSFDLLGSFTSGLSTMASWASPVPTRRHLSPLPLPLLSTVTSSGSSPISVREVLCGTSIYSSSRVLGTRADVAVRSPCCVADQIISVAVVVTLRAPAAIATASNLRTSSVATMALNEIIEHGRISSLDSWDKAIIRAALRAQPPLQAASAASQKPSVYVPLGMSTCITESFRTSPAQLSEALPVRCAGPATLVLSKTVGVSPLLHRCQLAGCQRGSEFKPAEHVELLNLANRHLGCDESDSDSDSDSGSEIDPSAYFERPSVLAYGGLPRGDHDLIFEMDDL